VKRADGMLPAYKSWQAYIHDFYLQPGGPHTEGNFFAAKLFQKDTVAIESNGIVNKVVTRSRTRGDDRTSQADDTTATPSRSTRPTEAFQLAMGDLSLSDSSPFPSISPPRPTTLCLVQQHSRQYNPVAPSWPVMYPNALDEQFVNTALLNFLRAMVGLSRWQSQTGGQ
jgi:hypothetical protein